MNPPAPVTTIVSPVTVLVLQKLLVEEPSKVPSAYFEDACADSVPVGCAGGTTRRGREVAGEVVQEHTAGHIAGADSVPAGCAGRATTKSTSLDDSTAPGERGSPGAVSDLLSTRGQARAAEKRRV